MKVLTEGDIGCLWVNTYDDYFCLHLGGGFVVRVSDVKGDQSVESFDGDIPHDASSCMIEAKRILNQTLLFLDCDIPIYCHLCNDVVPYDETEEDDGTVYVEVDVTLNYQRGDIACCIMGKTIASTTACDCCRTSRADS